MGIFDKLHKLTNGLFDGLQEKAVNSALTSAHIKRIEAEELEKKNAKIREKEELEKILSKIPMPSKPRDLKKNPLTNDEIQEIERRRLLEIQQKEAKKEEKQKRLLNLTNKYGEEAAKKIIKSELFIGMTFEMLKEIRPKYAEKVENAVNGKSKTVLYYDKSKNRLGNVAYGFEITLLDGKVVGWKDRRNRGTKDL